MSVSPTTVAAQLRELIQLWGDATQEEVAKKFGVRREYISRVLNGLDPSEQFKASVTAMLDLAKQRHGRAEPPVTNAMVEEALATNPTSPADLVIRQISDEVMELVKSANNDLGRLGWLLEELRALRREKADWGEGEEHGLTPDHERAIRSVLADERRTKKRSA